MDYYGHNSNGRLVYLDALRTIACFTVVMLHVTAANTYHVEFRSHEWSVFMFYESIVNWAVPMFVMISGTVMLGKEYDYKTIIHKVLRIVKVFILWSVIYLVSDLFINADIDYCKDALWLQVLIQGHYHMWYLIMLCGLYLIVPLIKAIVDSPVLTKAFILLSVVFTFLIPSMKVLSQLREIARVLQYPVVGAVFRAFCNFSDDVSFYFTLGFCSYFVLGFILFQYRFNKNYNICIGLIFCVVGSLVLFWEIRAAVSKEASKLFMQYYQIGVLTQTLGIYLIAMRMEGSVIIKILAKFSPLTLGVYIIHPIVLEILQKMEITSLLFNPLISIPSLTLLIVIITAIITLAIMRTPLAGLISIEKTRS